MIAPLRNETTSGSREAAEEGSIKNRRKDSKAKPFETMSAIVSISLPRYNRGIKGFVLCLLSEISLNNEAAGLIALRVVLRTSHRHNLAVALKR